MVDKKEEFRYIVRIANTNIDGNKKVLYGISQIKGIGYRIANVLIKELKLPEDKKMGELSDEELEKIKGIVEKEVAQHLPDWMMNRRRDPYTGDYYHYIGTDLNLQTQDDINKMKKVRSYKGIRHERGLQVRGQRTKANGRVGMSIGILKTKKKPATAGAS